MENLRYLSDSKQWVGPALFKGDLLKAELLGGGIYFLTAGTIMVFSKDGFPKIAFQLLSELMLDRVKNTTLIGYERGSVVNLESGVTRIDRVPTLKFEYCRLPYETELRVYNKYKTV